MLTTIGDNLDDRDESGKPKVQIATIFPAARLIITNPPMHALQRQAFVDMLNQARVEQGKPRLTEDEEDTQMLKSVDLIQDQRGILIRPDPSNMELAFVADELLQYLRPKREIKFMMLTDSKVRSAIKRRGECWRIYLPPDDCDKIKSIIENAKCAIGGQKIYYYSPATGSRFLTFDKFSSLASLPDSELHAHLLEIADFSTRLNRHNRMEIEFFMADQGFGGKAFKDARSVPLAEIRPYYLSLLRQFEDHVPIDFHVDNINDPMWRKEMYARIISDYDGILVDEETIGLDPDFSMRVNWVPGARIEDGELILDSVLDDTLDIASQQGTAAILRNLIFNLMQEYGDLEYINVGTVLPSPTRDPRRGGRRDVYIAQLKHRRSNEEELLIIRMQKWGVREKLDEGDSLEGAMIKAEEYTEYVLDRRLACQQLGMNLVIRLSTRKLKEKYYGNNHNYHGKTIWSPYFQRDYIRGQATNQLSNRKLANPAYALAIAQLMGQAAAPNIICGRAEIAGEAVFDVGDEIVVENDEGMPIEIVVADQVGTFVDWQGPLDEHLPDYAKAIASRLSHVTNPREFTEAFINGFIHEFLRIQNEYLKHKRAFDRLFKNHEWDPQGSLAYRWFVTLERMRKADPVSLAEVLRSDIATLSMKMVK